MSHKRPLSPESNTNFLNNDARQLKRLKLHSIIQQLQNEETNLVLLKKLRASQQLSARTNKNSSIVSNGTHRTAATRLPANKNTPTIAPTKSVQPPITNLPSQQQQQQPVPTSAIPKTSNSPLLTNPNKISPSQSYEEQKNQAKIALRKQLERNLLSIPPPKPTLQDITFVPNGASLEFQVIIGLEDVVQCLAELQTDRQRLPQRFTDHAQVDVPFICDQCGTDFTVRWWKHMNPKISPDSVNIFCDRCKKQVIRRAAKSEHSTLLKNVFLSAMKQEKDIEKTYQTLIKQEKNSLRNKSSLPTTITPQVQSLISSPTYMSSSSPQYQIKNSTLQNFVTKKSNTNSSRTVQQQKQQQKSSMPIHHHHQQQQQIRSIPAVSQHMKMNSFGKVSKHTIKQHPILPPSHPFFPPNPDFYNAFLASNLVKPTSSKRRTFPTIELK